MKRSIPFPKGNTVDMLSACTLNLAPPFPCSKWAKIGVACPLFLQVKDHTGSLWTFYLEAHSWLCLLQARSFSRRRSNPFQWISHPRTGPGRSGRPLRRPTCSTLEAPPSASGEASLRPVATAVCASMSHAKLRDMPQETLMLRMWNACLPEMRGGQHQRSNRS